MAALVEKYRPQTMAQFAGLNRPRAILQQFAGKPYNSAWLFLGPSGTGKTTLALALAKEIGAELHHIPSRKCDLAEVETVTGHCWYVPFTGKWHLILVDEADQMSRAAQLAFLSKLDTTAPPPNTIFVFTANATDLLEKRFLSRCRTLRFEHDGEPGPALQFLADIWCRETPAGAIAPDFALILRESEYNIRDAMMRLELKIMAPDTAAAPAPAETPASRRSNHHRAVPSATRPYSCPQCSAPSANRQGVVAHLRLIHHLEKPERDRLIAIGAKHAA